MDDCALKLRQLGQACLATLLALISAILVTPPAAAQFYIGPGYLYVPAVEGDAKETAYRDWIRAEARYWAERPKLPEIRGINGRKNDLLFTATTAPANGPNVLNLSVDKASRGVAALMDKCGSAERIAEVRFAESSETARHPQEHGPRPADVPAFNEFALTGVRIECPVVVGAPEQAFILRFDGIRWLNSMPQPAPRPIGATPAKLEAVSRKGATRTFAVNWFAGAVEAKSDQCPRMNTKASEADYFALMPPAMAARVRSSLAGTGVGPDRMAYRGPEELDVVLMPGIVPDPGHVAPQADVVPGFNLDDDLGIGIPPPGVRQHRNFTSPDGRPGIDNQLFTVEGCVEGLRRNGFLPMIFNEGRAAGRPTALVEISGIDDFRDDEEIWVTVLYSSDELRRSPAKVALPDYTYRVSDSPEFTQDYMRVRGRITAGVIVTEPADELHIHEVTGIETTFIRPRLRLEILPDGRLKGVIGGYLDWRKRLVFQIYRGADYENTVGLQAPAMYNAMKRAADGLLNPITGDYDGISAAFEIEGVPAFLPPEQHAALMAGQPAQPRTAHSAASVKRRAAAQ
jgi:hypothetical protein